jgi:glutamyl/glutaminyl-tRNA synthetase
LLVWVQVTHTSDSFDLCEQYAYTMIRAGLAYMDDTDQEKMQAERMARTESYRRNSAPAENEEVGLVPEIHTPFLCM